MVQALLERVPRLRLAVSATTRPRRPSERDGVHYSLGYSGHGVQMATYMGKQMALAMLGKPSRNLWEHLPYPAVPGHFGPPWFLPLIGGYAKVVDRFS